MDFRQDELRLATQRQGGHDDDGFARIEENAAEIGSAIERFAFKSTESTRS
jgi:hypothetical protein